MKVTNKFDDDYWNAEKDIIRAELLLLAQKYKIEIVEEHLEESEE